MQLHDLFEGGVKTAQLDTLARRALNAALPGVVKGIIQSIIPKLPPARPTRASEWDDPEDVARDEQNERIYQYIYDHQEETIDAFSEAVNVTLAKVVKDYASKVLPTIPGVEDYCRNGGYANINDAIIKWIRVEIETTETSTDDASSKSRGYYQRYATLMKVFIKHDVLWRTMNGYVVEQIYGEDPNNDRELIYTEILPTFLHEYAHFEQDVRRSINRAVRIMQARRGGREPRSRGGDSDFVYITPRGASGRGRSKGKRGGYARSPSDGQGEWARYLGSQHEIDSWATSAAAQVMDELQSRQISREGGYRGDSAHEYNDSVLELQRNLASGYLEHNSAAVQSYMKLVQRAFDNFYGEVEGEEYPQQSHYDNYDPEKRVVIDPKQIQKVYKIFCKKVASKLEDYKKSTKDEIERSLDPQFIALVKDKSFSEGVQALARRAARTIAKDQDTWGLTRDAVLAGNVNIIYKAEDFIRQYYLDRGGRHTEQFKQWLKGDDYDDISINWRTIEAKVKKADEIFRRFVLRYLERLDPERFGAEEGQRQAA